MIPLFGSVKPIALKNLNRPFASSSPRKRPVTEASVPITSASMKIERRTWPRVAPSVRSVANSRVRCAIVIESEFAITKLPTKSAMPPNASRNPRRNEMNESVSLASSAACWAPVRTCGVRRQDRLDLAHQLLVRDVRLGGDVDLVELARLVEEALGGRHVEARQRCAAEARRAGAELDEARDLEPVRPAPPPERRSRRRRAKCFFSAVVWSITTSSPCGQCPETSESGLKREAPFAMLKPRFGAPP